jgi:catechol 2,3-dioxygenase-like lactoylglutathione lyase family enzyme
MNLNQVTVPVLDTERAIQFYQKLGLKLIVSSPRYARFECPDGNSTFSVHQAESLPSGNGIYVYSECEKLDAKLAKLKVDGIFSNI